MFSQPSTLNSKLERGFTLIELLIAIAIVAIVAGASFIALNPTELFRRSRDSQRVADLNQLQLAVTSYVNSTTSADMDGPNYTQSCVSGTSQKLFVSVPSAQGGTSPNMPPNWTLQQVTAGTYRNVNGGGWLPIDFTTMTGGSPLTSLPLDPKNTWTDNLFYSYTCGSNYQFELGSRLESRQYSFGGNDDKTSTDGGDDTYVYETGSNLDLDPFAPVGSWSFDEGSGTTIYDASGYTGNGTTSANLFTSTGCKKGTCLSFDGISNYGYVPDTNQTDFDAGQNFSVSFWVKNGTGNAESDAIVEKWAGSGGYAYVFRFTTTNSSVKFGRYDGTNNPGINGTISIADSSAHFIVGVKDGSTLRLYIDGTQNNTISDTTTASTTNASAVYLATRGAIGQWYNGQLDEFTIYNRTLPAAEILQQYNALR